MCKLAYDDEESRYDDLGERTKIFISVQTIYIAAFSFKLADSEALNLPEDNYQTFLLAVAGVMLVLSLLLTVVASRILDYERPFDARDGALKLGDPAYSRDEMYEDRIADYVVATERNIRTNDHRARILAASCYFMVGGIACHLFALIRFYL